MIIKDKRDVRETKLKTKGGRENKLTIFISKKTRRRPTRHERKRKTRSGMWTLPNAAGVNQSALNVT